MPRHVKLKISIIELDKRETTILQHKLSYLRHRRALRSPAVLGLAVIIAGGMSLTGLFVIFHSRAASPPPAGWTTIFSDDFDGAAGNAVDSSNWLYDTGTSYPGGAANWGTGEVETVTNSTSNVYQDGSGHLVIKPIRDSSGHWTSGRIETQRTDFAAPVGGQLELTATLEQPNPAVGTGYWPAFWALGAAARPVGSTNWPSIGELDAMEDVNALSDVAHTFHCGIFGGGPCSETNGLGSGMLTCAGCQTGFHSYSVIVDRRNPGAEQLRFYTDDVLQYTVNQAQVPADTWTTAVDHGFFMILNVAIGGSFPNALCGCTSPAPDTSSGASMLVDSVSAYTMGASSTPTPTATTTATPTVAPTPTPVATPTPTPAPTLVGDINNDGLVNVVDLSLLLAKWGTNTTADDLNHDGTVNVIDLSLLLSHWHPTASAAPTPTPTPGTISAYSTIEAERYSAQLGTNTGAVASASGEAVTNFSNGDFVKYSNVDFGGTATQVQLRVASGAPAGVSGLFQVRLDSATNPPVATLEVGSTGGWSNWQTFPMNLTSTSGVHDVYITATSGQAAAFGSLDWLIFAH